MNVDKNIVRKSKILKVIHKQISYDFLKKSNKPILWTIVIDKGGATCCLGCSNEFLKKYLSAYKSAKNK